MAWFTYLILSLNKMIEIYYLVFAISGLGVENDMASVKRLRNKKVWETLI